MTKTLINKSVNNKSQSPGEYNYEDYSKTKGFKNIQVLEVINIKKFNWEWTSVTPNKLGIHSVSKKVIKKYNFYNFTNK